MPEVLGLSFLAFQSLHAVAVRPKGKAIAAAAKAYGVKPNDVELILGELSTRGWLDLKDGEYVLSHAAHKSFQEARSLIPNPHPRTTAKAYAKLPPLIDTSKVSIHSLTLMYGLHVGGDEARRLWLNQPEPKELLETWRNRGFIRRSSKGAVVSPEMLTYVFALLSEAHDKLDEIAASPKLFEPPRKRAPAKKSAPTTAQIHSQTFPTLFSLRCLHVAVNNRSDRSTAALITHKWPAPTGSVNNQLSGLKNKGWLVPLPRRCAVAHYALTDKGASELGQLQLTLPSFSIRMSVDSVQKTEELVEGGKLSVSAVPFLCALLAATKTPTFTFKGDNPSKLLAHLSEEKAIESRWKVDRVSSSEFLVSAALKPARRAAAINCVTEFAALTQEILATPTLQLTELSL